MAWSPFSYDGFDVDLLPSVSTHGDFDEGIVTSETLADDDSDGALFRSYQMTKESSIFEEMEDLLDDEEVEEDNMDIEEESFMMSPFDEADSLFDDEEDVEEHCGECDEDDIEECGDDCSPFEEFSLFEAVLDDGEDDIIADEVDDMTDDDDEEIDADAEGIDEIEADIIDDEEDDLIDMAMDAEGDDE